MIEIKADDEDIKQIKEAAEQLRAVLARIIPKYIGTCTLAGLLKSISKLGPSMVLETGHDFPISRGSRAHFRINLFWDEQGNYKTAEERLKEMEY